MHFTVLIGVEISFLNANLVSPPTCCEHFRSKHIFGGRHMIDAMLSNKYLMLATEFEEMIIWRAFVLSINKVLFALNNAASLVRNSFSRRFCAFAGLNEPWKNARKEIGSIPFWIRRERKNEWFLSPLLLFAQQNSRPARQMHHAHIFWYEFSLNESFCALTTP